MKAEPTVAASALPAWQEDWVSSLWYDAVYCASVTAFTLGWSLRTEGMHHVPHHGPALFISNHQSFLDPVLVGMAARRHLCYLARKSLFQARYFTGLIRSLNAVPIDQEGLGIEGLRVILHLLQKGRAVLVFPEGSRTPDGAIHPLKPGIQLLMKRAQAPVVPVGIAGAFEAWPRSQPLPCPAPLFLPPGKGTLAVSIGPRLDTLRLLDFSRERQLVELGAALRRSQARAEHLRRKPKC